MAVRWFRRARPADRWAHYGGIELAARPVVAEALARLPPDPALEYLLYSLGVGAKSGREWALTFGDESLILFDLSIGGTDIFEETLAAAPFTDTVERVEREVFVFTTVETLTADVTLAHCLDVCGTVFRGLDSPGVVGEDGVEI